MWLFGVAIGGKAAFGLQDILGSVYAYFPSEKLDTSHDKGNLLGDRVI